ncbi:glucan endo-1,3-beta-glucosidase-like [Senna tora]|uniref:glucan endo-1,3-beta-D-glucosidase n=1 Tax=Senna tora TaxID=362788 RepID=A0A834SCE2_9FABA|nr:glucan endo-1,3-beta-glucosidase-like [Senna tora]
MPNPSHIIFLASLLYLSSATAAPYTIGVNYGTVADNLPPPPRVASFLKSQTTIDRVKIFDANPDLLRAFADTGIAVTVTVGNGDIPSLSKLPAAQSWISTNILPFHPRTTINRIAVGNEILATSDKSLIAHLLPTMEALHSALSLANITTIQISTPHSLGILSSSEPPSSGRFRRGYDRAIFAPILDFHRKTKSPFMVNPYPFFGFAPETLDYALFRPNGGVLDHATGINYTNMFDAQMDAVFSAMKRVGYDDVEIVVAETGWPSAGDPNQPGASLDNAVSYNGNLIKHVSSGKGTPLMPNRTFEIYIFSLFNENLKPSVSERNYGLFKPDLTPVYDVGVLKNPQALGPTSSTTAEGPSSDSRREWCVARSNVSEEALQKNIDYVCSSGIDCGPISNGGACYDPNDVRSHASYAMNAYYQASDRHDFNCDFNNTGMLTTMDPSYKACTYPSSSIAGQKVGDKPETETGGSIKHEPSLFNTFLILASSCILIFKHFHIIHSII